MLKALGRAFSDFVFPPHCHVCRSFISEAGRLHVCSSCRDSIRLISSPHCTICAVPFLGAGQDHPCGSCIKEPPAFSAARAAFVYDGPGRELIHNFKYEYKIHLRRPLALYVVQVLSEFVLTHKPDFIVPVPLHPKRLRTRGFNQAVLIGEVLASEWDLPMERSAMMRTRWTEPQINLAASQRRENVKGAFAIKKSEAVKGKRILLLDDVYTTGSTVDECSKVLKKGGADEIIVITVARAIM